MYYNEHFTQSQIKVGPLSLMLLTQQSEKPLPKIRVFAKPLKGLSTIFFQVLIHCKTTVAYHGHETSPQTPNDNDRFVGWMVGHDRCLRVRCNRLATQRESGQRPYLLPYSCRAT